MSRTYYGEINQDFAEVKRLINSKTKASEASCNQMFEELKLFHHIFFKYRDVLATITYQNDAAYDAMKDGVEGMFDFIWLLIFARYKSSVIAYRASIEMLIKSLIRQNYPEVETNKFSNNVERLAKEFKAEIQANIRGIKQKKIFGNLLHESYTERITGLYKELSNITHGNYVGNEKVFNEYLQDIIDINTNYDYENFKEIIEDSIELLRLVFELSIMINFQCLVQNMNEYKLSLILDSLSEDFKKIKTQYLST